MLTSKNEISRFDILLKNNDLTDVMKQSFEFWHKNYNDSLINHFLVWKKTLDSNSEIITKIEGWQKNSKENIKIQVQQFFEIWSYAIRKPDFEIAKKTMPGGNEFWKNITDEQFRMFSELLPMIENYWQDIQNKNIE